ncbi:hypothetical protein ACFQAT_01675 [Undibacterium arcticum]
MIGPEAIAERVCMGLFLVSVGLAKKIVFSGSFAQIADLCLSHPGQLRRWKSSSVHVRFRSSPTSISAATRILHAALCKCFSGFQNLDRIYKILDNQGICVVSVIPPMAPGGFPPEYFAKSDRFHIAATRLASRYGRVISGNDDSFREFRLQPSNFSDLLHPSTTGTPLLSREMSRLIALAAADTAAPPRCQKAASQTTMAVG